MSQRSFNVLFVCPGDPTRAVMAQALLDRFGSGRFTAFSASNDPMARVDPLALELLQHHGLHSGRPATLCKAFVGESAPRLDFVIALSNEREDACALPEAAMSATWRITDPCEESGDLGQRRIAMRRAFREIETRVKLFALLRHEAAATLDAV